MAGIVVTTSHAKKGPNEVIQGHHGTIDSGMAGQWAWMLVFFLGDQGLKEALLSGSMLPSSGTPSP